jgi:hypothetical protein
MARKEKHDEKLKRRQSKTATPPAADLPEVMMDHNIEETDPVGVSLEQGS